MLIGAGEIIDHSWDLFRGKFRIYLPLLVWALIPSVVLSIAENILVSAIPDRALVVMAVSFLLSVPVWLVSLYVTITMIQATAALIKNEQPEPARLLRGAVAVFVPALLTSIAVSLIVLAGFVFFIIPGIIFGVWFAFSLYHTVLDGVRWREALRASRALTAGRWGAVLWRLSAPNVFWRLAVSVIAYALVFVINGLSGNWSIAVEDSSSAWLQMTTGGVSALVQGLSTPLFIISTLVLFFDLKRETLRAKQEPTP